MKDNEYKLTEQQVRKLRDNIYGTPISDKEWNTCKDNWMKPAEISWLLEHNNTNIFEYERQQNSSRS